jgi:hypothetical protein
MTKRIPVSGLAFRVKTSNLFLSLFSVLLLLGASKAGAQVDIWTQHNDNRRSGQNLLETKLDTSNVNKDKFGKLFTIPVDDDIYAQPLVVSNVILGSSQYILDPNREGKPVTLLLVATVNNTLYAFDADASNPVTLWWRNDLNGNGRAVQTTDVAKFNSHCFILDLFGGIFSGPYKDFKNKIGTVGTPVVKLRDNLIFFVTKTCQKINGKNSLQDVLHAVNILNGTEQGSVTLLTDKPVLGSSQPVSSQLQNQRAALALSPLPDQKYLYVAWGGYKDVGAYHGYLMACDADPKSPTFLRPKGLFCSTAVNPSTPKNQHGGIWQAAQGPVVDEKTGNLYFMTGNDDEPAKTGLDQLGDSFVKLAPIPSNPPLDYFTPFNKYLLDGQHGLPAAVDAGPNDLDLGSAGPILIPGRKPGSNFLLGGGKESKIYLLDPNNLGKFDKQDDHVLQKFFVNPQWAGELPPSDFISGNYEDAKTHHIHGSPVYWSFENPFSRKIETLVYVWPENDILKAYQFNSNGPPYFNKAYGVKTFMDEAVPNVKDAESFGRKVVQKNTVVYDLCNPTATGDTTVAYYSGMSGGFMSISADSDKPDSGILWVSHSKADDNHDVVGGILVAFKAAPETTPKGKILRKLWDSDMDPTGKDKVETHAKFCAPTVANGRVYLATFSNRLNVYGLKPTPTP